MTRDGQFRKASGSETTGCVEVAAWPGGGIRVRDSKKDRSGPVLSYDDPEWAAFVQAIKDGNFDLPG